MKMTVVAIIILMYSCDGSKTNIQTADEIAQSMAEATKNTIYLEGKFIRLEKINEKEYYLLKDTTGASINFLTLMPIGENEINLLKTKGNNIRLNYYTFYNKVRKKTEKVVTYMEPIYEFQK